MTIKTLRDNAPHLTKPPVIFGVTKTSFKVTWDALPRRAEVDHYVVEFDKGTRGTEWTTLKTAIEKVSRNKYQTEILDLEAGESYQIRIRAENEAGDGAPTHATTVTTFKEDTNVDITKLQNVTSTHLGEMELLEEKKWFLAKEWPWYFWVQLLLVVIGLAVSIANYFKFIAASPKDEYWINVLRDIEPIVATVLSAIQIYRVYLFFQEQEIFRFSISIIVAISNVLLTVALWLSQTSLSYLIFVFFAVMFIVEILQFFCG